MNPRPTDLMVDIVIDNYNYGAFLAGAIESACAQTHERVNVIVVDDGSTDGSRELLSAYENRVEVVLKENGGQASALNAGFERCHGDVVIVLDADDLLHPAAAARAAAAFAADPSLVKVQQRMDTIDAGGRSTGAIKPPDRLPMPEGDVRQEELAFPFDLTWLAMSGNAFRAEALRRILPIPEPPYRICADWYLVHMTALLGTVASLQDVGASYRVHGSNNYEQQTARLDLDHVRQTVGLASSTIRELERLADEIGLDRPARIISLWDLANRLISLRLDPRNHPIADDSRVGIVREAIRGVRRRTDSSATKKLLFVAWFAIAATAPGRWVPRVAEAFFFPERRPAFNGLPGRQRRQPTDHDLAGLA